jgi:hypothetical protein
MRKSTSLILIGLVIFATFSFLLLSPQSAAADECEDRCYDYYFECRKQGGSLEDCTNNMMQCLKLCGWPV